MAPIHRIEMYHEHPPPIPIKLKPKNLKKLAAQSKGPVYVLLPNPPPPPPLSYHPNFTLMPNPSLAGSISENGSAHSGMLDNHQRFRPDRNVRPRVQQLQWMRHGRNSSNWVKHLTSSEDEDGLSPGRSELLPRSEIQLSSRVASMTIADVSPRFALKVSFIGNNNIGQVIIYTTGHESVSARFLCVCVCV